MADYYPLLAKAVAGLADSTPEARQAIYGRARGALINQLRSIQPPVPEQDIDRESRALDEAVKRIEREIGGPEQNVRPPAPGPRPPAEENRVAAPRAPQAPGKRRRPDPMHPVAPQAPRQKPSTARFWIVSLTILAVLSIIGVTAWALRDRPEDLARLKPPAPQVADSNGGKLLERAAPSDAQPSAPIPTVPVNTVPIKVPPAVPPSSASPNPPPPAASPSLPGSTAPTSAPPSATATAAPPASSAAAPAPATPLPSSPPPATPPASTSPSPAPAGPSAPSPAPPGSASPAAPAPAAAPPSAAATANAEPVQQPAIPIAYRAALLVEAPDDPKNRVKTYVGTVVWRVDNVAGDQGQPLTVAVHADIDLPEARLKVSMTLKKNTDAAFEASHTMVLGFTFAPGSEFSGVKEIKLPRMRNEDSPDGDPLIGVGVVPIMDNFFLVGLAPGESNVDHNLDLLRSRGWIDVPLQLANGRIAKITFEKGVQGDHTMSDAITAWK